MKDKKQEWEEYKKKAGKKVWDYIFVERYYK